MMKQLNSTLLPYTVCLVCSYEKIIRYTGHRPHPAIIDLVFHSTYALTSLPAYEEDARPRIRIAIPPVCETPPSTRVLG